MAPPTASANAANKPHTTPTLSAGEAAANQSCSRVLRPDRRSPIASSSGTEKHAAPNPKNARIPNRPNASTSI